MQNQERNDYMKKSLLFLLCLSIVGVSGCDGASNTESPLPEAEFTRREEIDNDGLNQYGLANNVQDGVILHAWNWSYKTIKDNIQAIASAGYSAVQTSPVQQSKSTSTTGGWNSSWAMLYQPVSFSIAQTSWLGSKQDLSDLCAEADKYGVKVICDIVLNHMANDNTGKGYSERINEFEPEIFQNKETYFHQYDKNTSDISIKDVTQAKLSDLPDLNTSNEYCCIDKTMNFQFERTLSNICNKLDFELCTTNVECTTNSDGCPEVRCEFEIIVSPFFVKTFDVFSNISKDESKPINKELPAIVLYFAKSGESVWDIAMRYNTTINNIMSQNALTNDILTSDKMLIIPGIA